MSLQSPIYFTASNPQACDNQKSARTILRIIPGREGERPDWDSDTIRVYQAEGTLEAKDALNNLTVDLSNGFLKDKAIGIVTTLGIDPKPFQMYNQPIYCMVECYAQAGNDPYGRIQRMRWQAKHEGWKHIIPTLGVYDNIDLQHYLALNGGDKAFANGHWHGGPLAIYLGEGMTDTNSWDTADRICGV